jgi:hypothetical protein
MGAWCSRYGILFKIFAPCTKDIYGRICWRYEGARRENLTLSIDQLNEIAQDTEELNVTLINNRQGGKWFDDAGQHVIPQSRKKLLRLPVFQRRDKQKSKQSGDVIDWENLKVTEFERISMYDI